jgi:hypothetical protein
LGTDVVGAFEIAFVDLGAGYEMVDLNRLGALYGDRVEFLIFNQDEGVLRDLIAATLILGFDRLPRYVVNKLLAEAVAGRLVDLAERHPLARCRRGVEGDGTGNERELQIALPIGPGRGHDGYSAA